MSSLNKIDIKVIHTEATKELIKLLDTDIFNLNKTISDHSFNMENAYDHISRIIDNSKYWQFINNDKTDSVKELMLKTITNTLMSVNNTSDINNGITLESFNTNKLHKTISQSALLNAITIPDNKTFLSVFFPPEIVPFNQNGLNLVVNIPIVSIQSERTIDGEPLEYIKRNMLTALKKPLILNDGITKIIPFTKNLSVHPFLVDQSIISDINVKIKGIIIPTRPIAFQKSLDLISLSTIPEIQLDNDYNETDVLDNSININDIYYTLKVTRDINTTPIVTEVVLVTNVSMLAGSLFNKALEGDNNLYNLNLNTIISINQGTSKVNGNLISTFNELRLITGLAIDSNFTLSMKLKLNGTVNLETAIMEVWANKLTVLDLLDEDGIEIDLSLLDPSLVSIELIPLGYIPDASKTNSNLRNQGTIISNGNEISYRFPIPVSSPISVDQGVNGILGNTDWLSQACSIRASNNAVDTLLKIDSILKNNIGNSSNSTSIGSVLVKPTYVSTSIDIDNIINVVSKSKAITDVRNELVALITNTVNQLIEESDYLVALESLIGTSTGYEVICVTDPHIASHLIVKADTRTIGNNIDLIVTHSISEKIKGKIFISFRRKNRDKPSPLDFGFTLMSPSLMVDATVTRGSKVVKELQYTPRTVSYISLPILGVIEVTNMKSLFE